ncbi:MAG: tRNA (adenosine(37)-N6)-threonylcarbamoyltransferase complex dimerization subunit type 1 TsaB [Anaerolineae bacterium]
MLLAIDTSTRWASLALYDGTGIIAETNWRCWGNHTIEVLPTIAQMVKRAQAQPADIKAIAVAKGPGSFTGLRIGMSIAKGFCLALNVPVIAIPTLDIVAYAVGDPGRLVYAVLELGRNRICVAAYRFNDGLPVQQGDALYIASSEWQIAGTESVLVLGEISTDLAERLLNQPDAGNISISSPAASARRAGFLAELAWQRFGKSQVDDLDTISPTYLHLPTSGTQSGTDKYGSH